MPTDPPSSNALKTITIVIAAILLIGLLVGGLATLYVYSLAMAFNPHYQRISTSEPHPAITIFHVGTPFMTWKVDGSFQVQFTNGFVINEKTRADDLPKNWTIRRDGMPKGSGTIVVDDENGRHKFIAEIERNHLFTELSLRIYESDATFVDLRTQKTVDLGDSPETIPKVTEFFANAPR